jgi:hypothetical protein
MATKLGIYTLISLGFCMVLITMLENYLMPTAAV